MSTQHPQATIPDTELRMLTSSNGKEFSISVALPHTYSQNNKAYPVVYVLDANMAFGIATESSRMLTLFSDISEVVIVGIGYPVKSFKETLGFRTRDLTPTESDWYETQWKPSLPDAPDNAGSGQAADFLQFTHEKLIPFINTNYRTLPQDNTLLGFSFGGLFGLYTLFNRPDLFRQYIIGSPSIWWDNEIIFTLEKNFAAMNNNLAARVFMSVGGNEGANMIDGMYKMADILESRKYKGLVLTTRLFEGETHMSNTPAFVSWGLKMAFAQIPVT